RGDAETLARLAALVGDGELPAVVRATAVETLAQVGAAPIPPQALHDPDPVVRASAAAAFGGRPPAERQAYLPPLLRDPLRAVRIAAARSLADIPDGELEPAMRPLRRALLADF